MSELRSENLAAAALLEQSKSAGNSVLLRTIAKHKLATLGGCILLGLCILALFAPLLGTTDPAAMAPAARGQPPSSRHWMGTDLLGRDLYSRVIYGTRVSLTVGIAVAVLSAIIGLAIGLVSGFVRWLDFLLMRLVDGMMAIPPILLAIALMALTKGSLLNVVIAITIAEVPRVIRLVRGEVLSVREKPFVDGAIAAGTPTIKIIFRHVLPNILAPVIVQTSYICAAAMLVEAILSFIGAGVPPSIPSWGNIIAEGRVLWQVKPYVIFFPALFLSITVLSVNLLGDGLRDLLDPRRTQRS